MDSLIEVIIPTYINCHLFWIIEKKNLLIRSAFNRIMKNSNNEIISYKNIEELIQFKMVGVNMNGTWARATIKQIFEESSTNSKKVICWLCDYGIMRETTRIYKLPTELSTCPQLARQASLYNVVNLTTELKLGATGCHFQLTKTLEDVEGVRKVAVDFIQDANKLFFRVIDEDCHNFYGDVVLLNQNQQSLTESLIERRLLATDEIMFNAIDQTRQDIRRNHFSQSSSWYQELDKTETINLKKKIFNDIEGGFSYMN